jgi:cell filamentation protein
VVYAASPDPYCYRGTTVLKNVPGIRDAAALRQFEAAITAQRADEPLAGGRLSVRHYQAIHHHLFQDVYRWAGRIRTVRISKGNSTFCYPEHIHDQLRRTFNWLREREFLRRLTPEAFASGTAHFFAELNAIHPFRDGNGRTQLSFVALLAAQAGYPLALRRLAPRAFLRAAITSFYGDERPLTAEFRRLIDASTRRGS